MSGKQKRMNIKNEQNFKKMASLTGLSLNPEVFISSFKKFRQDN
jgi:hypothetical protein